MTIVQNLQVEGTLHARRSYRAQVVSGVALRRGKHCHVLVLDET